MANLQQPQGVTQNLTAQPAVNHVQFVEDEQITLPNFIHLKSADNTGTLSLIINDGLLRTHQDSINVLVDNTSGTDFSLSLIVAKKPIVDLVAAQSHADEFITAIVTVAVKADELRHLQLNRINGQYVLADRYSALPH